MSDEATVVAEAAPAIEHPLNEAVPGAITGTWADETEAALFVAPDKLLPLLRHLKEEESYDYLSSVTCTDYLGYGGKKRAGIEERFDVIYHLFSTKKGGGSINLHVRVPEGDTLDSATGVYPGANLQECEVYDLYGIRFAGHPNLRRVLTWEGFHGHPMRKDWKEAYFEEDAKPFRSRHPKGGYEWHEDKLPWGKNTTYPPEWDPESWEKPVAYVPVSQAPHHVAGDIDTESLVINFGPHHPSTHGVFRMLTRVEGETITALEPEMGYLHRNHEKIGERNTWLMNMPFTDRLDYLNSMSNNWAYALAVEKLAGIEVPERAEYIRVIMAEFSRTLNHMWSIGFILNDLGALQTPALYAIEEREMILDLFEEVSGARLMCNYMRFGGVVRDLTPGWVERARYLASERLPRALDQLDRLLSENEVLHARGAGVGYLPPEDLIALSITGPMLRAAGVKYDIRKAEPYGIYNRFEFDIPTLSEGDIYARYYIRLLEAREAVKILQQALRDLPGGEVQGAPAYASATLNQGFGTIMGGKGGYTLRPPEGEAYHRIEAPKGELGFYLVSDGKANPFRYHIRSPSYINLNGLGPMCVGYKVADAVVVLGAIDIVLGEVDR
jgi:NADH-quinone oxidoreductase subunit D/NADH-quinone oxidoreductase subunit C/D